MQVTYTLLLLLLVFPAVGLTHLCVQTPLQQLLLFPAPASLMAIPAGVVFLPPSTDGPASARSIQYSSSMLDYLTFSNPQSSF